MKRRQLLSAALATTSSLLIDKARAGFGIFQVKGSGSGVTIPTGVDFQDIDGNTGTTSSGTGTVSYYGAKGFTKATATGGLGFAGPGIKWNALAVGGLPASTYPLGWDDPHFYSIRIYLSPVNGQSDITRWVTMGMNTAVGLQSNTGISPNQMDLLLNNGISLQMLYVEYGIYAAGERAVGNETVCWYTQDEPQSIDQLLGVPLLGNSTVTITNVTSSGASFVDFSTGTVTGGVTFPGKSSFLHPPVLTGAGLVGSGTSCFFGTYQSSPYGGPGIMNITPNQSVSGITVTQAAIAALTSTEIGGRFIDSAMAGPSFIRFKNIGSSAGFISANTMYNSVYTASNGATYTGPSNSGYDLFFFNYSNDGNNVNGLQKQVCDVYDTSGGTPASTMQIGQIAKGPHYGNMLDYMRQMQTNPIPMWPTIENADANGPGIKYDPQPVEMAWAAWGAIIHGARSIVWFNQCSFTDVSGCGAVSGGDVFNCPFMQSAATATFTGTISAGVLTTTGAVTGNICPGMVSTAGVSGQIIVLQQTNNFTTPGVGVGTTFKVATLSGAGTVTGTITLTQSVTGVGGNTLSGASLLKGMVDGVTLVNTRIRDMAPIINSPFAVQQAGGSLGYIRSTSPAAAYIFPSDTGKKNSFPPQSIDYGLAGSSGTLAANAIDCCAKYFTGTTYTTSLGDTINAAFYIIATTRYEENHAPNISVSFTINDPAATSITVIGESRTINFTSGQGTSSAVFSDTFDFAWTTRIYRVNH